MEAIHIPWLLKLPGHTDVIEINQSLPELATLTPVRGRLEVIHQGQYLEVGVQAEAIVTLTCDRCLQQYNHRLAVEASEVLWLDESAQQPDSGPLERETLLEDLVETLPPQGDFQPDAWLYEQICLALPPRQLCDQKCPGIAVDHTEAATNSANDRRWAALEALKRQLPG
jgi:uncharacterized protein